MGGKAYHKRLGSIDNAHIIAELIVLAGFVCDRDFAADTTVQFMIHLLQKQGVDGERVYQYQEN